MKRKSLLALVVLVMIVITATMLAGCSSQKITAEDYANIIKAENLDKIEDFKMSDISVVDGLARVESYAYDKDNETAKYIVRQDKKENDKVVAEITEYILDIKNNKTYKLDNKTKKYSVSDDEIFTDRDSALIAVCIIFNSVKFEEFDKKKNYIYTKDNSTLTACFRKDQISWFTIFDGKDDKNNTQMVFEVMDQKIKVPSAKKIAA